MYIILVCSLIKLYGPRVIEWSSPWTFETLHFWVLFCTAMVFVQPHWKVLFVADFLWEIRTDLQVIYIGTHLTHIAHTVFRHSNIQYTRVSLTVAHTHVILHLNNRACTYKVIDSCHTPPTQFVSSMQNAYTIITMISRLWDDKKIKIRLYSVILNIL